MTSAIISSSLMEPILLLLRFFGEAKYFNKQEKFTCYAINLC